MVALTTVIGTMISDCLFETILFTAVVMIDTPIPQTIVVLLW
jgi:hypothetical protein